MRNQKDRIIIRECTTVEELGRCVDLQREIFALPEVEISPVRHFIVTRNAGGFTLGAFLAGELIGFVLSIPASYRGKRAFYSHMTAVKKDRQSAGIGRRLKWAQRERALSEGVNFVKWTFEPVKARNAFFNLEKLGAVAREYEENFYGTDYATRLGHGITLGLASDRLFAEWHLESPKVKALAQGDAYQEINGPEADIAIMDDWPALVAREPERALSEQLRIRAEFKRAFAAGMMARGFAKASGDQPPKYLLYKDR